MKSFEIRITKYFFKTVFLAQQIFIKQVIACFFIKKKLQKNIFVFNNRSNDDMTATSSRMSEVVHGQIKKN